VLKAQLKTNSDEQKNIRHMDIACLMAILRDKRNRTEILTMIDDRIEQLDKIENQNYRESYETTKGILQDYAGSYI
jgi:hypothetical protein